MSKIKSPRKLAAITLVGLGLAGVSVASAASLTLNGEGASAVQAGTISVDGTCQESPITFSFTLDGNNPGELATDDTFGYPATTDAIVLTAIDEACAGKTIKVALGDSGNNSLGEYAGDAEGGPLELSLADFGGSSVDASDVAQVSVTIFD
jgi:hypothetical protein